ncbi:MAG: lytic transglycosylase F, partial [Candidatus Marinimicrobia bacterium]|nr:lytic transglycosylase F [Candidatus Neomarinimicrobiota bacterium]
RIPARINDPDKLYFALAAYNLGLGHVEDARILTQRKGFDPDLWVDVKQHLPLLKQKQHYQKTKYGFARGDVAVKYVENIRRYHDSLF